MAKRNRAIGKRNDRKLRNDPPFRSLNNGSRAAKSCAFLFRDGRDLNFCVFSNFNPWLNELKL